jgi:hypothetical protein
MKIILSGEMVMIGNAGNSDLRKIRSQCLSYRNTYIDSSYLRKITTMYVR